jgi:SAM-dependent methyltransferase
MLQEAVPSLHGAVVLEDGCGVGVYIDRMRDLGAMVFGLDYELERVAEAARRLQPRLLVCGEGEHLPYRDATFDVVLSTEVIEHVRDDRAAVAEMVRVLRPGGRAVIFCPNRWYPVEQHGVYWRGRYRFGNIPLVNYLPDPLRNRLAPHVRAYTARGLLRLFDGLPVRVVERTRIFGGYDNITRRFGRAGGFLRDALHGAESTPLKFFGLSHLVVVERT